jgi:aspartate ammonia-lyase
MERNLFTPEELEVILSPTEMTHPGIAGLEKLETRVWDHEQAD